ncbi:MAG: FHA domain-containing protein [Pseudomonadota bacterium]|nr:MAG: hypothetical protein DIU78_02710 [Pseudomonadota bacterium]
MWKLTIEDDQSNRTVVHLVHDVYSLGRAEDNAIRLTERNISRHHARLERSGQGWALRDLDSYNGCYVNGRRVAGSQELGHGDLVQLGDYRLIVEDDSRITAQDQPGTVPASPNLAATVDRLLVLNGPNPGFEYPLSDANLVIGRGEECDICINHQSVSRVHAEIHPLGDGRYEIVDRNSSNGVRVNGVELPRGFVDARDVIELGDVVLKFLPAGDTYIPGSEDSLQISASGATRRREAEQTLRALQSNPIGVKVLFGLAVLALVAAVAVVLATRKRPATQLVSVKDATAEHAERILSEAKALLVRGDVRGAHRKAAELPVGSNARMSPDFRAIQAAYADHLFELAETSTDRAEKRTLYDEIARSPAIDSERRRRAADRLSALGSDAVSISDLPEYPARAPASSASAARRPAASSSAAEPTRPAKSSSEEREEKRKEKEASTEADETPRRRSTEPKDEPEPIREKRPAREPTTLVRENPFDSP